MSESITVIQQDLPIIILGDNVREIVIGTRQALYVPNMCVQC